MLVGKLQEEGRSMPLYPGSFYPHKIVNFFAFPWLTTSITTILFLTSSSSSPYIYLVCFTRSTNICTNISLSLQEKEKKKIVHTNISSLIIASSQPSNHILCSCNTLGPLATTSTTGKNIVYTHAYRIYTTHYTEYKHLEP